VVGTVGKTKRGKGPRLGLEHLRLGKKNVKETNVQTAVAHKKGEDTDGGRTGPTGKGKAPYHEDNVEMSPHRTSKLCVIKRNVPSSDLLVREGNWEGGHSC